MRIEEFRWRIASLAPVQNSLLLALLFSLAACGSTATTPGPSGDTSPPVVSVTGTGGELRGSFSASASDGQSSITAHRLYLNGILVRSGASGAALMVTDTTLAPGSYTVRGEATSSGGTGSNSTTFTVTAPVVPLPPTASNVTSVIDEAATGTVNLLGFTTGQANRTISIQAPASLDATIANGQLTYKARDNGSATWDDVNGGFAIPYTVTDANGTANGTVNITITAQPDLTYTFREVGDSNQALTNLTFRANGIDFTAPPEGGKIQLKTGTNTLELKSNANWRDLQVWQLDGKTLPLNQNDTQYAITLSSADLVGTLKALHATIHPQYRAGAQSETDVRAAYWPGGPNTGFAGNPYTNVTAYIVRNPTTINGFALCEGTSEASVQGWIAGVNRSTTEAQNAGLNLTFTPTVVDNLPAGVFTFQNNVATVQPGTAIYCDKNSATQGNVLILTALGHYSAHLGTSPSGLPNGGRLDESAPASDLTPREASGASAYVRASQTPIYTGEGPSDTWIKKSVRPYSDAAAKNGMKALKF